MNTCKKVNLDIFRTKYRYIIVFYFSHLPKIKFQLPQSPPLQDKYWYLWTEQPRPTLNQGECKRSSNQKQREQGNWQPRTTGTCDQVKAHIPDFILSVFLQHYTSMLWSGKFLAIAVQMGRMVVLWEPESILQWTNFFK